MGKEKGYIQVKMVEAVFRCNICKDNKIYTSKEAYEHKKKTSHNNFKMLKNEL
uniref:C2H2-type domain-containing protein n=1 Tax=viral metagenome TaxID=1070528 RepID=A0A6M3JKT2_9ZZZZ